MPQEGMDRKIYLNSKFGSMKNAEENYLRITNAGIINNIYFQFSKIKKTPNSFFSHKLLAYAFNKKKQNKVLESLFYNYFIEGADIGNLEKLLQIAKDTEIYDMNIKNYIISNEDNQNLINEEKYAKKIGISGVPCFIFNKEFVLSGAQPKENFINLIKSLNYND